MTKRVLLIAFLIQGFLMTSLVAQDTIIFNNGKNVIAKIIEIEIDKVKYKKFENLNGPTYTYLKTDILSITYQNGSKDEFVNINDKSELLTSGNITDRISKKGSKVYIESVDSASILHAKRAIEYWGFWTVTNNKSESDFVVRFIFTSIGLGDKKGKAQFIDPVSNNIVLETSTVNTTMSWDVNTKRGVINKILKKEIKPLIK